jgi:hypothetical protein
MDWRDWIRADNYISQDKKSNLVVRHDLGQLGREEASLDDHVTSGKLAFERVVDEVLFKRRGGFN